MKVEISKGRACGSVAVPQSKSIAHRALISASLSDGTTFIPELSLCDDVYATIDCLRAGGYSVNSCKNGVSITGMYVQKQNGQIINCRESGSTLRFLLPVLLAGGGSFSLSGSRRLLERPLSVYADICKKQGIEWNQYPDRIDIRGKLQADRFVFPGNISSQFVSGLMLSLPHICGDSEIILTTEAESLPYITMTTDVLSDFGYRINRLSDTHYSIPGGQTGHAVRSYTIPYDESNAAFFSAFNCLGGNVRITQKNTDSRQGDAVWRELFAYLETGKPTISVKNTPDLFPICAVIASLCNGAIFTDTARLSLKESRRAECMARELAKCGILTSVEDNSVIVYGGNYHSPDSTFSSHNDHRIAMALSVLSTVTGGVIDGCESVNKSMPGFYEALRGLGIGVRFFED